jgi:hypothetical protein
MIVLRTRRRVGGWAICLGIVLVAGLTGCDAPIEAIRSVSGINKNDPDPATSPYNTNLEKAESGAYPNLASVPPPPEIASTTAERQKIAQNLTGVRSNTEASDTHGPGTANSGPVPPPPQIPSSIAAPEMAALPPPTPKPETPIPPLRKMDEPPLPAPVETPMQTPQVANLPGVEASHPAPGQGHPAAMPQPAPSNLPRAAVQSGNPQPAPPQATFPPPQVSPQVAALPPPKLPPKPIVVAALDVAAGAAPGDGDRARLAPVVAQYQQKPRPVRVVAYAAPGIGSAEQLNAFRAALDRAQAVAKQLSDAGIPAKQIQAEAAPASAAAPPGRIEVQLLQ